LDGTLECLASTNSLIAITQQNNVLYNIMPTELKSRKDFVSGVRKQNNEIMKTITEAVKWRAR
jgi:hypothetical protein